MCGYQSRQDNASFLIAIAFTEYMLDASEGVPNQLRRILGRDREGNGHTIGVLGFLCKPIRHEKDRHDPGCHIMST